MKPPICTLCKHEHRLSDSHTFAITQKPITAWKVGVPLKNPQPTWSIASPKDVSYVVTLTPIGFTVPISLTQEMIDDFSFVPRGQLKTEQNVTKGSVTKPNGRPRLSDKPLTPAERKRRQRAKVKT